MATALLVVALAAAGATLVAAPPAGAQQPPGDAQPPASDPLAPAQGFEPLPVPSAQEAPTSVVVRFAGSPHGDVGDGFAAMAVDRVAQALGPAAEHPGAVQALPTGAVRITVDPAEVDGVVARLNARADVEWAEPEALFHATATHPNDPETQWHLKNINMPEAWDHTRGSADVKVAVIDTAVDAGHPDLAGKMAANVTIYSQWCGRQTLDRHPMSNHGTAAAGLAAAATNNGIGIAGIGWNTRIIGVETLCYRHDPISGKWGWSATSSEVATAIVRAVALDADVINLSLGRPSSSHTVKDAVDYALDRGVVVVASAGNSGNATRHYPAAYEGVVAVAATTSSNQIAGFSTRGSWVEIAAPGEWVRSLCHGAPAEPCSGDFRGTSFAAPIVAGAVALLQSCERDIGIDAVRDRLRRSSAPISGGGSVAAWGRLDVDALLSAPSPGYVTVTTDGAVEAFGGGCHLGELEGTPLNLPIVGAAAAPNRFGYWMVASDGGVFSFGNAAFHGSTGNIRLNQPIVGMSPTPSGSGYRMVASDGGIFAFGDAGFFGSTGAMRLNRPIVGMASTPSGRGYWLVASDGGIFAFGDAAFYGSTGNIALNQPIRAMAATPSGHGYWMVARDGGLFSFGDAGFYGSGAGRHATSTVAMLIA